MRHQLVRDWRGGPELASSAMSDTDTPLGSALQDESSGSPDGDETLAGDRGLPKREPGASPMAAAGAAARAAVGRRTRRRVPAENPGVAGFKGAGVRSRLRIAVAAVALLATAGGFTLLVRLGTTAHRGPGASPSSRAPGAAAPGAGTAPAKPTPSGSPAPGASSAPRAGAAWLVTGVGCAHDGAGDVILDSAPTGPGWKPASGGGWTGDGCDGSTAWTMDPNGTQPAPSTVTWKFHLAAGVSRCTVAVFVPTRNALGVSEYSVFTGAAPSGAAASAAASSLQAVAAIRVSQARAAGQWLTLGTFDVPGTLLKITAVPVPGASGPGHQGAIAASAARVWCS
jgi:hypothetical protein